MSYISNILSDIEFVNHFLVFSPIFYRFLNLRLHILFIMYKLRHTAVRYHWEILPVSLLVFVSKISFLYKFIV